MDIKNSTEFRYNRFKLYNDTGIDVYDYERYGILNKCLPKIFFKGNSFLVTFLQLIDLKLIMILKYIDRVKRFKYITWYE